MAIPKFYIFIKPFLTVLGDGQNHTLKELKSIVAPALGLTPSDMKEVLPSGRQTVFDNRINWAGTYLAKAGLVTRPARATFAITEDGRKVLEENPSVIDINYLSRFDCFRAFQTNTESSNAQTPGVEDNTPDDTFEAAFKQINQNLADDLLSEVVKLSDTAFEVMVIDLLKSMGYGAFENSGRTTAVTGDEGIDGIIMEDKLGFNLIYIQAKKWDLSSTVGRPEIQKFVGAIAGRGGKGLFVTTAKYSSPAKEYADLQHIVLIDGTKLAELMIEHNFGVSVKKSFEIKTIDMDVFNEYADK